MLLVDDVDNKEYLTKHWILICATLNCVAHIFLRILSDLGIIKMTSKVAE